MNATLETRVLSRSDVPDSALVCDGLDSFGHAIRQMESDPFADPVAIDYDNGSFLVGSRLNTAMSQRTKALLDAVVFGFARDTSVRTFMGLKRRLCAVVHDERDRERLNDALFAYVGGVDDNADDETLQRILDTIESILVRASHA